MKDTMKVIAEMALLMSEADIGTGCYDLEECQAVFNAIYVMARHEVEAEEYAEKVGKEAK